MKKTSVLGTDDTFGQSRASGQPAETTEEPQLNESSSTANTVNTQQVLVQDQTVLPVGSPTPASLSKPSSTAANVSEMHKMVNSLFPGGEIVQFLPLHRKQMPLSEGERKEKV